jgi:hypothetical protein
MIDALFLLHFPPWDKGDIEPVVVGCTKGFEVFVQ